MTHRRHRRHDRYHTERTCYRERRRRGPIGRVVRGLAERLGVHRHTVIAAFVIGFVFVPMLTLLVFLGALYWANDPPRTERRVNRLAETARAAYRTHLEPRLRGSSPPPSAASPSPEEAVPDFPELRRKFEELESRARAMESCVASEEFALHRQFRAIDR